MTDFFSGDGRLPDTVNDTDVRRAASTTHMDDRPEVGVVVVVDDTSEYFEEVVGKECVIVDLDTQEEKPYLLELAGPEIEKARVPFRFWAYASQFHSTK